MEVAHELESIECARDGRECERDLRERDLRARERDVRVRECDLHERVEGDLHSGERERETDSGVVLHGTEQ